MKFYFSSGNIAPETQPVRIPVREYSPWLFSCTLDEKCSNSGVRSRMLSEAPGSLM